MKKANYKILFGLMLILLGIFSVEAVSASAATRTFSYKEYQHNTTVEYSGTVPTYVVNSREVDMTATPAFINDRGIAMASANAIFRDVLGATCTYSPAKGHITIQYFNKTLVLTMNSTRAIYNGRAVTASCEPFRARYEETGEYVTFVPTRYVAEVLGMEYNWNSYTGTVTITAPMNIMYGEEDMAYIGQLGRVFYNSLELDVTETPGLLINNTVMLEAYSIISSDTRADMFFDEDTGSIEISRGDITLQMTENDPAVYINGLLAYAPMPPVVVNNERYCTRALYVPARFVFETLGYSFEWKSASATTTIRTKSTTGKRSTDYEVVKIINTNSVATSYYDNEGLIHPKYQEMYIGIPEEVSREIIDITDDFYNNRVIIDIPGDHRDLYENMEIQNPGVSVKQVQILYYPKDMLTRIYIYTTTDNDKSIIGCKWTKATEELIFTFDTPKQLFGKVIVLDAGHGGSNAGVQVKGYKEKDITLTIVNEYCREIFDENPSIHVYYTRTDDTDVALMDRATLAGRLGADMFISIHMNSIADKNYSGTTTYYGASVDQKSRSGLRSSKMAQIFQKAMVSMLEFTDRGTRAQDYDVTKYNTVPAVLIECGFMSNPDEFNELITEYCQRSIAHAVYIGVQSIYSSYDGWE